MFSVVRGAWCVVIVGLLLLLASCGSDEIVWSADHETGDLTQWKEGQGDAIFNNGTGTVTITESNVHSGNYGMLLRIDDARDEAQGARIFRYAENLEEGYYSAWFFFPEVYEPDEWWNIFQFKSKVGEESLPTWIVNVGVEDDGEMYFYLFDHIEDKSYAQVEARPIPTFEWVHLEMFVRRSDEGDGRITLWQNGVTLFDVDEVATSLDENIQWSVNNYTDNITPNDVLIYVDDAVIARKPQH